MQKARRGNVCNIKDTCLRKHGKGSTPSSFKLIHIDECYVKIDLFEVKNVDKDLLQQE